MRAVQIIRGEITLSQTKVIRICPWALTSNLPAGTPLRFKVRVRAHGLASVGVSVNAMYQPVQPLGTFDPNEPITQLSNIPNPNQSVVHLVDDETLIDLDQGSEIWAQVGAIYPVESPEFSTLISPNQDNEYAIVVGTQFDNLGPICRFTVEIFFDY